VDIEELRYEIKSILDPEPDPDISGRDIANARITDARLWHPWLRINRVMRVMLATRWDAATWPTVKAQFKKALALRSQSRHAGWFNQGREWRFCSALMTVPL
jgi:hypothetical protein